MKKTIFGFICAILIGCAFASCEGNATTEATSNDSTEVVDSVSADSVVTVDSVAADSVA